MTRHQRHPAPAEIDALVDRILEGQVQPKLEAVPTARRPRLQAWAVAVVSLLVVAGGVGWGATRQPQAVAARPPADAATRSDPQQADEGGLARTDADLLAVQHVTGAPANREFFGGGSVDPATGQITIRVKAAPGDARSAAAGERLRAEVRAAAGTRALRFVDVRYSEDELLETFNRISQSAATWAPGLRGSIGGGPDVYANVADLTVVTDDPAAWTSAYAKVADPRIRFTTVAPKPHADTQE